MADRNRPIPHWQCHCCRCSGDTRRARASAAMVLTRNVLNSAPDGLSFLLLMCTQAFFFMIPSCNGNYFRVTGPLWEETTGHRWIVSHKEAVTRGFNVYLIVSLNKLLNKQSVNWDAVTPMWPQCNTHTGGYATGKYLWPHYSDVVMNTRASQITGTSIVSPAICSGADQRNHQSSASLAFVRVIHRPLSGSPHQGPVTRKIFPFDDVIMNSSLLTHENVMVRRRFLYHWPFVWDPPVPAWFVFQLWQTMIFCGTQVLTMP